MKKILSIILCFMPISAYTQSMCVEDDIVAVVLDPSIKPSLNAFKIDSNNFSWNVQLSYGKIYATSACLSTNHGSIVNEIIDNGNVAVGGELNGTYCYCRLIHPVMSAWWLFGSYSGCASKNCAERCSNWTTGNSFYASQSIRASVFSSITQ